jgi:DTW domain-containing protein YfiP
MEARKTKNGTGRLAHLALPGSELLVGVDFSGDRRVTELIQDPAFDCRLLYPGPAGGDAPPSSATPVLFVLDATWPCAKKMVRLSSNLQALPRQSIRVGRPSEFLIKHQPDPTCLATVEAVDRVLVALAAAGHETYSVDDSDRLLLPFRRMNAMALAYAAAPGPKKYRRSGRFKTREERLRTRTSSGRNTMFLG